MADRPTTDELAAMRARCEAATEGPWEVLSGYEVRSPHGHICEVRDLPRRGTWMTNAAFVAAARTDLPAALDEIDALRAERDTERAAAEVYSMRARRYDLTLSGVREELKRLRDERSAIRALAMRWQAEGTEAQDHWTDQETGYADNHDDEQEIGWGRGMCDAAEQLLAMLDGKAQP